MVRYVAAALNRDERSEAYVVESEDFESYINHSAYALIECDKIDIINCCDITCGYYFLMRLILK